MSAVLPGKMTEADLDAHEDERFRLIDGADLQVSSPVLLITDNWPLSRMYRRHGAIVFLAAAAALGAFAYSGFWLITR